MTRAHSVARKGARAPASLPHRSVGAAAVLVRLWLAGSLAARLRET